MVSGRAGDWMGLTGSTRLRVEARGRPHVRELRWEAHYPRRCDCCATLFGGIGRSGHPARPSHARHDYLGPAEMRGFFLVAWQSHSRCYWRHVAPRAFLGTTGETAPLQAGLFKLCE